MGFTTPAQDASIFKYFQVNEERTHLSLFLNFSYACPEPVLAE